MPRKQRTRLAAFRDHIRTLDRDDLELLLEEHQGTIETSQVEQRELKQMDDQLTPLETELARLRRQLVMLRDDRRSIRGGVRRLFDANYSRQQESEARQAEQRASTIASRIDAALPSELRAQDSFGGPLRVLRGAQHALYSRLRTLDAELRAITRELNRRDRENEREEARARRREVQRQRSARLASFVGKSRDTAVGVRQSLPAQERCPYCSLPLDDHAHADHIYPIRLGGLSTEENMVWVCDTCNQRKGSMTLRQFIAEFRLDRARIEKELERLDKTF